MLKETRVLVSTFLCFLFLIPIPSLFALWHASYEIVQTDRQTDRRPEIEIEKP